MNSDILYTISKYITTKTETKYPKLNEAIASKENITRKIKTNQRILNQWIQNRNSIEKLIDMNIYRHENYEENAVVLKARIDMFLSTARVKTPYDGVFVNKMSDSLVPAAKKVNFGLRKKILKLQLEHIESKK